MPFARAPLIRTCCARLNLRRRPAQCSAYVNNVRQPSLTADMLSRLKWPTSWCTWRQTLPATLPGKVFRSMVAAMRDGITTTVNASCANGGQDCMGYAYHDEDCEEAAARGQALYRGGLSPAHWQSGCPRGYPRRGLSPQTRAHRGGCSRSVLSPGIHPNR